MNTLEWAENECRIACKRENPEYDFESNDFDYGCSCYKSALKAYKSLFDDGHSGFSFGMTKNILIRLLNDLPLTPIVEKDFNIEYDAPDAPNTLFELTIDGAKVIQCKRMSSLFRREYKDGTIKYKDIDRFYFIDIDNPKNTYYSCADFLDEMFPIKLPYMPKIGKYKIYARTFLVDKQNGDFDTRCISHMITPEGERVELNLYYHEENGTMAQITKEKYDKLYEKRILS